MHELYRHMDREVQKKIYENVFQKIDDFHFFSFSFSIRGKRKDGSFAINVIVVFFRFRCFYVRFSLSILLSHVLHIDFPFAQMAMEYHEYGFFFVYDFYPSTKYTRKLTQKTTMAREEEDSYN